jgi:hypothetical protein
LCRGNLRQLTRSNNVLATIASDDFDSSIFDDWASKKIKQLLQEYLQTIFPGKDIQLSQKLPQHDTLELEIFIPSVGVALEYQVNLHSKLLNNVRERWNKKQLQNIRQN